MHIIVQCMFLMHVIVVFRCLQTPDGIPSLKHWYALLAIEPPKSFNLKVNYKLSEQHVKPRYYQKMNVAVAFQVIEINFSTNRLKMYYNR